MGENEGKKKTTFIIIGGIIITILLVVFFFISPEGVFGFLQWVAFFAIVAFILFLAVFLAWHLFIKPHKIDLTYINKQKIISSAKLSKPPMVADLWLSGDAEHQRFRLGRIEGWTRLQIRVPKNINQKTKQGEGIQIQEQDVFVIQPAAVPFKWFTDPIVIRVSPEDHTPLVGDVHLKGFSLIRMSEYYFLNHEMLDVAKIDYNILQEGERSLMFLMMSDMKEITDNAIGINPRHNIQMQQTKMLPKVPPPPTAPPAQ